MVNTQHSVISELGAMIDQQPCDLAVIFVAQAVVENEVYIRFPDGATSVDVEFLIHVKLVLKQHLNYITSRLKLLWAFGLDIRPWHGFDVSTFKSFIPAKNANGLGQSRAA
jgi:hypothetical protein